MKINKLYVFNTVGFVFFFLKQKGDINNEQC